jgi:hypothetical protein
MSLSQLPVGLDPGLVPDAPEGGPDAGLSRRSFLALAGAVGAALALPVGIQRLARATEPDLVAARFTPLVGQSFSFELPAEAVPLVLVAVEGLGSAPVTEHAFALRFTGPVARRQGGEVGMLRGPGVSVGLLVVPSSLPGGAGQTWVATIQGGTHSG